MLTKVLVGDWPLAQDYGPASYDGEPPGHGFAHWHDGVDLGCPTGTVCIAAVPGVVARAGQGYLVLLDGDGIEHYYFHISALVATPNQHVPAGASLCLSGAVAVAGGVTPTGPHLHYGVRRAPYGYQVDDFHPGAYYLPTFGPAANAAGGLHLDADVKAEFDSINNGINLLSQRQANEAESTNNGINELVKLVGALDAKVSALSAAGGGAEPAEPKTLTIQGPIMGSIS